MPGWARSAPSSSAKRETVMVQCSSTLPSEDLSTGRAFPPMQMPMTCAGIGGQKCRSQHFSDDSPAVAGARLPHEGTRSGGRARGLGCAPGSYRFSVCGQDSANPAAQPTWASEPW